MIRETERELFKRSQESRAQLNKLEEVVASVEIDDPLASEDIQEIISTVKYHQEMIARRTDPAGGNDDG